MLASLALPHNDNNIIINSRIRQLSVSIDVQHRPGRRPYLCGSKWGLCIADLRTSASGRMAFCGDVLGLLSESALSSSTSPIALT